MKKFLLLIILFLAGLSNSYSQEFIQQDGYISHDSMMVSVSAGYGLTSESGINDYYNYLINEYSDNETVFNSNSTFGNSILLNAQFLFTSVNPPIWMGISAGYLYTSASSSFLNNYGNVSLDGSISSLYISFLTHFVLSDISGKQFYLTVKPGLSNYLDVINLGINDKNGSKIYSSKSELYIWSPSIQFGIGLSIPLSKYFVSFEADYLITNIGDKPFNVNDSNGNSYTDGEGNCDQSGLLLQAFLGLGI